MGREGCRAAHMNNFRSIAFVASQHEEAKIAFLRLMRRYPHVQPGEADVIVALGGDGFMLETIHENIHRDVPIFGMNRGSVGFLMNTFSEDHLLDRLSRAEPIRLSPLRMNAIDIHGGEHKGLALNEVSLLRQTRFAAKLRIRIDGIVRMPEMICDGVLLSTPAGSTAYNVSAHGPILPLKSNVLALTPISAFRPRRWRGAILPHEVDVVIEVIRPDLRPVSATADFTEVRDVVKVSITEDHDTAHVLLFDPEHDLEERIIKEQFLV